MPTDLAASPTRGRDWSVTALLVGTFCATTASFAQLTALGKQVYDLTHRELDLGLIGLAEFAPAALLVLVTGAVADRFDRRRVVALALTGEAVAALALALYMGSHPTATAPIFAILVGFGVARAFAAPAARALPADIVVPGRLPWLVPRFSATWQAALIAGPVLGGFLVAADPRLPYLGAAGLLVVGAVAILGVRSRPARPAAPGEERDSAVAQTMVDIISDEAFGLAGEARPSPGHEAIEGLRFIRRQPVLLGAISLDLFAVLFGGAVALLPAIADDRLHVGAVGLGWLRAAGGIGAAVVTLGLAVRPVTRRLGRILLVVVGLFGVATVVLGVTRSYLVAFLAMVALSGADAVSVFIRATLVPLATPVGKRGRVLAVENVFIGASNELGAFESGVAGQLLGTAAAVTLGGVATLLIAAGWWVFFPALRSVDRFPDGT